MATKLVRFCRIDSNGESTTFHLETSSKIVLRPDGTNVEDALIKLGAGTGSDNTLVSPSEFKALRDQVSALATAALNHLSQDALDKLKADIEAQLAKKAEYSKPAKFTIGKSRWLNDDTAGYPYYFNIDAPGVTEDSIVTLTFAPNCVDVAATAVVCSTCESYSNAISVRCKNVPSADLNGTYTYVTGG